MKRENSRAEIFRRAGPYLSLGVMFAAGIGLGVWGGYKADEWLGTKPWLTVTGVLLGFVVGVYNFYVVVLHRPEK